MPPLLRGDLFSLSLSSPPKMSRPCCPWRPHSVPTLRTAPRAAWPPDGSFPNAQRQRGRQWQARLGPSIQGLSPELTGIVCLKKTGLVPGRRLSAWGSSIIHHGGTGAGGKESAFQGPDPQGGAPGLLPQDQPQEDVRKANERPDSCNLLRSAWGPL